MEIPQLVAEQLDADTSSVPPPRVVVEITGMESCMTQDPVPLNTTLLNALLAVVIVLAPAEVKATVDVIALNVPAVLVQEPATLMVEPFNVSAALAPFKTTPLAALML